MNNSIAQSCLEIGKKCFQQGDYSSAIKQYRKILENDPRNEEALFEIGKTYYGLEEYPRAIKFLKKCGEVPPVNEYVYILLAKAYRAQDKNRLAIEELEKVASESRNWEVHFELGLLYQKIEDYDLALKEFKQAQELDLDNAELHLELGRIYSQRGEYSQAIGELVTASGKSPGNGTICFELGRNYRENKEYDLALEEFKKARELEVNNSELHLEMGRVYYQKEEPAKAIEELKKASGKSPANGSIHFEIGGIFTKHNQYNLAQEELKKALELDPDNGEGHAGLGRIYGKIGELRLAIGELEKAVKLDFDDESIRLDLGQLYREIQEYEASVKEFDRAIESNTPKNKSFANKILNEKELSERKIVLKSMPRGLIVTLTNRCNLRCIMCDVWKFPWDIPEKVIGEIIEFFPCLQKIHWQGGEVFLLDYFGELFDKAGAYPDLKQHINTNGLLVTEKWAKRLVRGNVNLDYSIDGISKETYEDIRRGAKFEELLKSVEMINKHREEYNRNRITPGRMITTINFVVMRSNYHEIDQAIDFAQKYKFSSLQLSPVENVTGPENIFLHPDPKAVEYIRKVIPEILEKAKEYDITLHNYLPRNTYAIENNNPSKSNPETKRMLCYLPWQYLFINGGGVVLPHCFCKKEIGNIYDNSLAELWNNEMMQLYRRKILRGEHYNLCNSECSSNQIPREYLRLE